MARTSKQGSFSEAQLGRWKLLADFQCLLAQAAQYLCFFLFGLFTPVVRTMRGRCAASSLPRGQAEVCGCSVSLGSFSEAQPLVNPLLLDKVFAELGRQLQERHQQEPSFFGQPASPSFPARWLIQDSTLWEARPRMHWALWRTQGTRQNAVRLHLSVHVLGGQTRPRPDHSRGPLRAQSLAGHVAGGRRLWGDRYLGEDYRLLSELDDNGSAFVLRLRENAAIQVEEELPLTEEDRAAGVIRQAWAVLGCKSRYRSRRVRVVWVEGAKEVLVLVTNQRAERLSAALVSQLYKSRWQVELFFRWINCILGCRHWLAESPEGVALQIYLALIAALLLQLHTGRRPTKRMTELISCTCWEWRA